MLPPKELLDVRLTIGGAEVPLTEAELHLSVDDTELGEGGRWVKAAHPEVQLSLSLRFSTAGAGLIARIPPQHLGLPVPPDEPPDFAVIVHQAEAPKSQRLRISAGRAELAAPGISATIQGTLPDGRPLSLVLRGVPSSIQATVLEAQGSVAAERWLALARQALRLEEAGETSEVDRGDEGDRTLLQRWSPRAWVEVAAAERAQDLEREAKAKAVALRGRRPTGPAPEPSPDRPLVVGHRAWPLRRGELQLSLQDRDGATQLALQLELVVDEHSGEDGALAPSFYAPLRPLPWSLPLGGAWATVVPGEAGVEAWYGNDAPELRLRHFAFRLVGDHAELVWRATYYDGETEREELLHFWGPVDFGGLSIEGPGDLESVLAVAFDPASRASWSVGPIETAADGRRRAHAQRLGLGGASAARRSRGCRRIRSTKSRRGP